MHKNFYKNIKDNFTLISLCIILLLCCPSTLASKADKNHTRREYAFDVTSALGEYKRYYWHYPDSKESFIAFAENYVAHFWNDLTYKDKTNATWFQSYMKIKKRKNNCQITIIEKNCIFTDFKERQNLIFVDDICNDCKLNKMNIADFKRCYSLCAFDQDGDIIWEYSDSLSQLYLQIQQKISAILVAEGALDDNRAEMILFKYRHNDGTITFICDLDSNDSAIFEIASKDIYQLLNDFCNNTDIVEINMYVYVSK